MCPLACHCYFCRDGYYEIAIYNDPIIASEAGHLFTMPMSPTWGILVHTCIIMYVKNVSFTTFVTPWLLRSVYTLCIVPLHSPHNAKHHASSINLNFFLVCVYALSTRAQYLFVYQLACNVQASLHTFQDSFTPKQDKKPTISINFLAVLKVLHQLLCRSCNHFICVG